MKKGAPRPGEPPRHITLREAEAAELPEDLFLQTTWSGVLRVMVRVSGGFNVVHVPDKCVARLAAFWKE